MRSRFCAFATSNADHLYVTWDPATRPTHEELQSSLAEERRWVSLAILDAPSPASNEVGATGEVEFAAVSKTPNGREVLRERSRFRRTSSGWIYVDGDLT